jgi:hypothetical protein
VCVSPRGAMLYSKANDTPSFAPLNDNGKREHISVIYLPVTYLRYLTVQGREVWVCVCVCG